MGFRTARKLYKLVFEEDSDLYGLEIVAKASTLGERRDYLLNQPTGGKPVELIDFEAQFFIDHVTDWNLEDEDGKPLDISVESLYTLDNGDFRDVLAAYTARALGPQVSEPLKKESSSGNDTETTPSIAESLPMEPLS